MNHPITERQREVLGLVQKGSTMREICAAIGAVSTNAANDHVRALIRKGAIKEGKGRGHWDRLELTPFGLLVIGLAPCPTCKGCGTVQA